MASGEDLLQLFEVFKSQDQEKFTKVAFDIIKQEEKKNHNLLVEKLKKIIYSPSNNIYTNSTNHSSIGKIPQDKDNGLNLLNLKLPNNNIQDVILKKNTKEKIDNIILENKKKDLLNSYGLTPKKKILFCGPPGCGKTLTVETISTLLDIPILYTKFDAVVSSYLGETATNLSKIFNYAENGRWLIFFDEFDAIGKSRDNTDEHGELKRVVNTFLQLMDNFQSDSLIFAATNYEKLIDNALWRRFDEVVYFGLPSKTEIKRFLKSKFKQFKCEVDFNDFLNELVGLSFADIDRICIDSIKRSVLQNFDYVSYEIFEKILKDELKRLKLIKSFK